MASTFVAEFDGWEYEITGEDILYLGVALYGETRAHHSQDEWARILWVWLNRFMLHGARGKIFRSLAHLIENHAQPVNPKWRLGGEKCPQVGADGSSCAQNRLEWRAKMAGYLGAGYNGFRSLPGEIQDFVLLFSRGCVLEPPSVDGSPLVGFGSSLQGSGTAYEAKGNYFVTREQYANAGGGMAFVPGKVDPPECGGSDEYDHGEGTAGTYVLVAALGAVALAALWYIVRTR